MWGEKPISKKDVLNLAWNYFQQHAAQRISFFHFFVLFSSLMTTGLITTFNSEYDIHPVGVAIGLMLSLISFVFWKVDERNKHLTKLGENALMEIEKCYPCKRKDGDGPNPIQIFQYEVFATGMIREGQKGRSIWNRQISHSKSFNILFCVYGIVGILGALYSAWSLLEDQSKYAMQLPAPPGVSLPAGVISRKVIGTGKIVETISVETEKGANIRGLGTVDSVERPKPKKEANPTMLPSNHMIPSNHGVQAMPGQDGK